jgi:hypothetical protein
MPSNQGFDESENTNQNDGTQHYQSGDGDDHSIVNRGAHRSNLSEREPDRSSLSDKLDTYFSDEKVIIPESERVSNWPLVFFFVICYKFDKFFFA